MPGLRARVLVATSCASMGLDIPNIRLVVHVGVPTSDWIISQQMGRAGRDGQQAVSVMMASKMRLTKPGEILTGKLTGQLTGKHLHSLR